MRLLSQRQTISVWNLGKYHAENQIILAPALIGTCVWAYQTKGQLEPIITALSTLSGLLGTFVYQSISSNSAKIKAKGNVDLSQSHSNDTTIKKNVADVEADGDAKVVQK